MKNPRPRKMQSGASMVVNYNGRSSTLGESVDNLDNLSDVDYLDLVTLGLDIGAILPLGP